MVTNYGEGGGYNIGWWGQVKFYPYKKWRQKRVSHVGGGHNSFKVVLTQKLGGRKKFPPFKRGTRKVLPCLEEGVRKVLDP